MTYAAVRYAVLLSVLSLIASGSSACYAEDKAPKPDVTITTTRQMIDLNENSAKYEGKVVKVSGAWVSGDDIRRDADEKIYCMEFHFGTSFDASERFGSTVTPYPGIKDESQLGFTVDLDDALDLKEALKSRKSSSLTSYVKSDLYFKVERRKAIKKLYIEFGVNRPVGHLIWINLPR